MISNHHPPSYQHPILNHNTAANSAATYYHHIPANLHIVSNIGEVTNFAAGPNTGLPYHAALHHAIGPQLDLILQNHPARVRQSPVILKSKSHHP
jgi:hypothetical protein